MKRSGEMYLPDADEHFERFAHYGIYQTRQFDAAMRHVKSWNLAVDVGAHIGFFTRALGKRFDTVVAFEPQPENFLCLNRNRPGNAVIHNLALGAGYGFGALNTPKPDNSGAWELDPEKPGGVTIRSLDSFCLKPDFIKIDVQGSEPLVLKGGEGTIKAHRPVILIERNATNVNDGVPILESWGYRCVETVNRDCVMVSAE